jgi:hypothetical protein
MSEFAIRRIQRRLQGLEDELSSARLDEALATSAGHRRPHRDRQAAILDEIERQEARLRKLIACDEDQP